MKKGAPSPKARGQAAAAFTPAGVLCGAQRSAGCAPFLSYAGGSPTNQPKEGAHGTETGSAERAGAAIARLAQRVRELEAAQGEKDRYELAMLEPSGNAFAYRLRPAAELSERQAEPAHFLCQPCFDLGRNSVLTRSDFYGRYVFKCSGCKTDFDGGLVGGQ